jgi:hypothetical protein
MTVLPRLVWKESPNQSDRHGATVSLIVAHRWGSPVAHDKKQAQSRYDGNVAWLRNPDADASSHVVYGGSLVNEAAQLVPWARKAWTCVQFNSISDNIEFADAIWSGDDTEGFRVAARIVAFRLHARSLPAKWVRGEALLHGGRGVTRHYDLGQAGGGHTDPTTDSDVWREFMARVAYELRRSHFLSKWGR